MDVVLAITGEYPLLMHSDRLSDPLDPMARSLKTISSRKKKSDADHEEMARVEFLGSIYWDEKVGPYIPARNVRKCLVVAARMSREGPSVEQGVFITAPYSPLIYDGPREPEELFKDERFRDRRSAGVAQRRVMRTRPVFPEWSVNVPITLVPGIINLEDFRRIASTAGARVGLGDYRPVYGRFRATVEPV